MFFKKIAELVDKIKSTREIRIFDMVRSYDYIGEGNKTIRGIVEIRNKRGDILERTNNLVVYDGREFAASKVFNKGNYVNWNITHYGVGKGGTSNTDPTSKIGPDDNDTGLYDALTLNSSDSSYLAGGTLKPIGSENIIIEQDPNTNNHYTRVKINLVIDPAQEPDLLTPAKINEAGIFCTDSNGNYKIFAHVTFTDKYIEQNEKLFITWYILF